MKKKTRNIFIAVVGCVVIAAAVMAWGIHATLAPAFELSEEAYIYVRPATTEDDILQQLRDVAHARSLVGWNLLRLVMDFKPQTGRYAVHPDESVLAVLRKIRNHQQEPVRLTLPSVRRLRRLASILGQQLMMDSTEVADAFADSAFATRWGYTTATLPALFIPDTYEVYWDMSLDTFMKRMQRENAAFWSHKGRAEAAKALGMSREEVVTLASIVAEETNYTPEKPRIAGVYLNRLHRGIPLQADPTVKFATGDDALRRIRGEHLRTQSPYNTYIYRGLPPGPIRIPSAESIDAVLHAEHHNFLFFCAREDFSGSHRFAATYPEHMQNARRYQRALNERGIR